MITLLLPRCGISDLLFKLRITLLLVGSREFNIAIQNRTNNRNQISEKFIACDLGFNSLGLHHIDSKTINKNDVVNPHDVFKDESILDQNKDVSIDLDYPFWKHDDMMAYAAKMTHNHPALEKAFMSGDIYKNSLPDSNSSTVFVHYRLGDVALVPGTLVNKALSVTDFVDYVLIGSYLIKTEELRSFLAKNPPIKDRIIIPDVYATLIDELINEEFHPVFCSDGYTLTSRAINKVLKNKISTRDIEEKLTSYMLKNHHKIIKNGVSAIVGENEKSIEEVFKACLQSKHWVRGTSGFPFSFFLNSGIKERFKHQLSKSSLDDIVTYVTALDNEAAIIRAHQPRRTLARIYRAIFNRT
jgi:hypothetical protein